MKKIRIYFIILAVVVLNSCSDKFLEEQNPYRQTTETFWQTEADLQAGVAAMYNPMTRGGDGYYGHLSNYWPDVRIPDYWADPFSDWGAFSYLNTTSDSYGLWSTNYQGIFYANQVIEYGGAAPLDDAIKNKYVAEAYFMRGLYYFFLVIDYGSVPIHTTLPKDISGTNAPKSTEEEVWQQVISDFTKAAEGLPETRANTFAESGHATKGAALAFLGRSYLYRGDWANAQTTLKSIVDNASSYNYKLQENFGELFDGKHENAVENGGGEGIFAIQFAQYGGSNVWNSGIGNDRLWGSWQSQAWAPGAVGGWDAGVHVYKTMLYAFLEEPTADGGIDPRAEATVAWDHNPTPSYDADLYAIYQEKGYPFDPNYTFFQKNYHETWGDAGWTVDGKFVAKFFIKKYEEYWKAASDLDSYLDYYCMRYDDVLLMLAEAYAQQGMVTEAAPYLKQIRDRAKLAVKDFTASKEVMMSEIRHQRHLEFSFEQHRLYDLRRWGLMAQEVNAAKRPHYERYQPKFDYLPIPQQELDVNPLLEQNPLWK